MASSDSRIEIAPERDKARDTWPSPAPPAPAPPAPAPLPPTLSPDDTDRLDTIPTPAPEHGADGADGVDVVVIPPQRDVSHLA